MTHFANADKPNTPVIYRTPINLVDNNVLLPSAGLEMSSSLRATGRRLRLIGVVACLLAANRGSNCSLMRAMDGRIVRCGIISSCQSAATSEIVKSFWS